MFLCKKFKLNFFTAKIESKLFKINHIFYLKDQTPFGLDYYLKCKDRLLQHFKSDLIINMDNMRISDT